MAAFSASEWGAEGSVVVTIAGGGLLGPACVLNETAATAAGLQAGPAAQRAAIVALGAASHAAIAQMPGVLDGSTASVWPSVNRWVAGDGNSNSTVARRQDALGVPDADIVQLLRAYSVATPPLTWRSLLTVSAAASAPNASVAAPASSGPLLSWQVRFRHRAVTSMREAKQSMESLRRHAAHLEGELERLLRFRSGACAKVTAVAWSPSYEWWTLQSCVECGASRALADVASYGWALLAVALAFLPFLPPRAIAVTAATVGLCIVLAYALLLLFATATRPGTESGGDKLAEADLTPGHQLAEVTALFTLTFATEWAGLVTHLFAEAPGSGSHDRARRAQASADVAWPAVASSGFVAIVAALPLIFSGIEAHQDAFLAIVVAVLVSALVACTVLPLLLALAGPSGHSSDLGTTLSFGSIPAQLYGTRQTAPPKRAGGGFDVSRHHFFPWTNLAFEGVGTAVPAVLGALSKLDEYDVTSYIRRFAGTETGALLAVLGAMGMTVADMRGLLHAVDIADLTGRPAGAIGSARDLAACSYATRCRGALRRIAFDSGDSLRTLARNLLALYCGNPDLTLLELYEQRGVELALACMNVELRVVEYLHPKLFPRVRVCDALVASVGDPSLVAPARLREWTAAGLGAIVGTGSFVAATSAMRLPLCAFDGWFLDMTHRKSFIAKTMALHRAQGRLGGVSRASWKAHAPHDSDDLEEDSHESEGARAGLDLRAPAAIDAMVCNPLQPRVGARAVPRSPDSPGDGAREGEESSSVGSGSVVSGVFSSVDTSKTRRPPGSPEADAFAGTNFHTLGISAADSHSTSITRSWLSSGAALPLRPETPLSVAGAAAAREQHAVERGMRRVTSALERFVVAMCHGDGSGVDDMFGDEIDDIRQEDLEIALEAHELSEQDSVTLFGTTEPRKIVQLIDVDGDGAVSMSEFLEYVARNNPGLSVRFQRGAALTARSGTSRPEALRAVFDGCANALMWLQLQPDDRERIIVVDSDYVSTSHLSQLSGDDIRFLYESGACAADDFILRHAAAAGITADAIDALVRRVLRQRRRAKGREAQRAASVAQAGGSGQAGNRSLTMGIARPHERLCNRLVVMGGEIKLSVAFVLLHAIFLWWGAVVTTADAALTAALGFHIVAARASARVLCLTCVLAPVSASAFLMDWVNRSAVGRWLALDRHTRRLHVALGYVGSAAVGVHFLSHCMVLSALHGMAGDDPVLRRVCEQSPRICEIHAASLSQLVTTVPYATGLLMMAACGVLAYAVYRKKSARGVYVFRRLHAPAAAVFVVGFVVHGLGAYVAAPTGYLYSGVAIAAVAWDRWQTASHRSIFVKGTGYTAQLGPKTISLLFKPGGPAKTWRGRYLGGCTVNISSPEVATSGKRTFTVAQFNDDGSWLLHIRRMGTEGWTADLTRVLEAYAQSGSASAVGGPRLRVQGPFVGPETHFVHTRYAVLLAGGVGVTPCTALWADRIRNRKAGMYTRFIWSVAERDLLERVLRQMPGLDARNRRRRARKLRMAEIDLRDDADGGASGSDMEDAKSGGSDDRSAEGPNTTPTGLDAGVFTDERGYGESSTVDEPSAFEAVFVYTRELQEPVGDELAALAKSKGVVLKHSRSREPTLRRVNVTKELGAVLGELNRRGHWAGADVEVVVCANPDVTNEARRFERQVNLSVGHMRWKTHASFF